MLAVRGFRSGGLVVAGGVSALEDTAAVQRFDLGGTTIVPCASASGAVLRAQTWSNALNHNDENNMTSCQTIINRIHH